MIKFSKKEKSFTKARSELNLNLYWKLAVGCICIFFLLSLGFGYYLFMQISQETAFEAGSHTSQIETVKKERIEKVLEYFSLRNQKSSQILISPAPVVDPSL